MTRLTLRFLLGAVVFGAAAAGDASAQWTTDALSASRLGAAAVTVGDKAFFAGGRDGNTLFDVVDVYDGATGDFSTAQPLTTARTGILATAVGELALFAGGTTSLTTSTAVVDVCHVPSMAWSTAALSVRRWGGAATTVGTKAIFAGGATGGLLNPAFSDVVDIYDASLGPPDDPAAWSTAQLSEARGLMAATSVGDQAVFAGGIAFAYAGTGGLSGLVTHDGTFGAHVVDTVDIYDDVTGTWSTAALSQARSLGSGAAATVGSRAWFGGGQASWTSSPIMSDVIDVYDALTGTWTTATLSEARRNVRAVALGDTILFAGGSNTANGAVAAVDVLDTVTDAWQPPAQLSEPREQMGGIAVAGRAIFAGGVQGAWPPHFTTDVVDLYTPTWLGLGGGTTGVAGVPALALSGPLTVSSTITLDLFDAAPLALALVFVSFTSTPTPYLGGSLHAFPIAELVVVGTDGAGELHGSAFFPGSASGQGLWFQVGVADGSVPVHGAALSNGVKGTVP